MAEGTRMQQRRATEADWNTSNYVLAAGEIGVTTDTGILKVGNGTSPWSELSIEYDGHYLPILGTAANAELLDGISADFFVKYAESDVNPTNNTFVKRSSTATVKGATAVAADDLVPKAQMDTNRLLLVSRNLTANATLAIGDLNKLIMVNHASTTAQVVLTVPRNSDVAFPVGTRIEICAQGAGGVKISPFDGTVGVYGKTNVMPDFGTVELVKIDTNTWIGRESKKGRLPTFKIRRTSAGDNYGSTYQFVPFDTVDTAGTYNPDNEWYSIPGTGTATARRIIINKDGEYTFTAAMASNGTGGTTYCRITSMTADNSTTGMKPFAVQSMVAVATVTATRRVVAGESFGVHHGFATGNLGKADAEATGGDPHYFRITRNGD